ncbi:MAG: hypothetical protein KGJ13_06880 [Patescibacteria group bacterium]|nr:hypothetical protein [Patescibacteria group bacterium]
MKPMKPDGLTVEIGADPKPKGDINSLSTAENVDTVPMAALAMPDDQQQMQPPEVGDEVNYQVTGKVVSIEGDFAKIQRTSINGQEIPDAPPQGGDAPGSDPDNQSMWDQASQIGML